MQKRGIADLFHFGNSDQDQSLLDAISGDWNLILTATNAAAEIAPPGFGFAFLRAGVGTEVHFGTLPGITDGLSEDASGGPDAAAAGGKKGGGGTTRGGGTTVPPPPVVPPPPATTTGLPDIPIHWQTLAPPTGDTALPTHPYLANQQ